MNPLQLHNPCGCRTKVHDGIQSAKAKSIMTRSRRGLRPLAGVRPKHEGDSPLARLWLSLGRRCRYAHSPRISCPSRLRLASPRPSRSLRVEQQQWGRLRRRELHVLRRLGSLAHRLCDRLRSGEPTRKRSHVHHVRSGSDTHDHLDGGAANLHPARPIGRRDDVQRRDALAWLHARQGVCPPSTWRRPIAQQLDTTRVLERVAQGFDMIA